jgi:hypothetical protein
MYGGAIFTTRMYLEDSKESIAVTPTYCPEEDLYDCIIDMVSIINQALESIKYEEKYNLKDYIIIEYWREQYE